MTESAREAARKILRGREQARTIRPGLHLLPAQGNALAVETQTGIVLMDAGPGGSVSRRMISELRAQTPAPVMAICYSHGHLGYNDGVDEWLAHCAERGDPPPRLVAHVNCNRRYARYRETLGLQRTLAAMQFPGLSVRFSMTDANQSFEDHLMLVDGARRVELLWAPAETDDTIAMWLPDDGVLYAGAAFPGTTIPNIGTPLRTQRFTVRWAETLERLAALGAECLIQEFGAVIEGAAAVRERLGHTAKVLRWFRDEVVQRMNRGMNEREILADMQYPAEMLDHGYLRARYGAPEYIVRDLYREENGWWDRNPTSLHPASPAAAAAAVRAALGPPEHVLREAEALQARGETQLALHVVDLLALCEDDEPLTRRARLLKAALCRQRAQEISPYVSKALFQSSAERLEAGSAGWQQPLADDIG
ncbi:MAG: alkyl sulfatase dimerization domain-containing protein [Burkholderiaceae bacterium]